MFGDFLGKMQETQQKMEEIKRRLDTVYVDAEVEGGLVRVTATANKAIKELHIDPSLLDANEKDSLEDLLVVAINRVLEKAEAVHTAEMQSVAAKMMGGLPGF